MPHGLITKRCIKTYDMPGSPHPPSAEVSIQGEIHPPPLYGENGELLSDESVFPPEAYISYNRCLFFTMKKDADQTMTKKSKYAIGNKQRRIGNVPHIWANFFDRSYHHDDNGDIDIRCVGMGPDGQPNGADAKNFPESAGRLGIYTHGAVSPLIDPRFLENPCFGDYLEVVYADSGLRLGTGSDKFGIPIVRNVPPSKLARDGGLRIGSKAAIVGSRGRSIGNLQHTVIAYNSLVEMAKRIDAGQFGMLSPEDSAYLAARVGSKVWEYKAWGMPSGANPVKDAFSKDREFNTKWMTAGFYGGDADKAALGLPLMAAAFGLNGDGNFVDADGKDGGTQLFRRVPHDVTTPTAAKGANLMNPFLRLPIKAETPNVAQDASLFGNQDAPSFMAQAARVFRTNQQNWAIKEDSPIYIRVVIDWKTRANTQHEINISKGAATWVKPANAIDKTAADNILNNFQTWIETGGGGHKKPGIPHWWDPAGTKEVKKFGLVGNENTMATIVEVRIKDEVVGGDKAAFCKDFFKVLCEYADASKVDAADYLGSQRISFGASSGAIKNALETFCAVCNGGGANGIIKTGDEAGKLVFGDKWDTSFEGPQKTYLKDNFLKKFVGFPGTVVMGTINEAFSKRKNTPFWTEHPAMRGVYSWAPELIDLKEMRLSNNTAPPKVVAVPLDNYFGVQYREDKPLKSGDGNFGKWAPATDAAPAVPTLDRMHSLRYTSADIGEDLAAANELTASGFSHKQLLAQANGATTGAKVNQSIRPSEFEVVDTVAEVKEQLDLIPIDPRNFIGIFMECTPDEPEVRMMLRAYMPS
jgi:hypothetical protein